LSGGQYKPRITGSVTFASLRSNAISLLCSIGFLTGVREVALDREEGGGIGEKLSPCILKKT